MDRNRSRSSIFVSSHFSDGKPDSTPACAGAGIFLKMLYVASAMISLISARKPSTAGLLRPRPFFPRFSTASLMMS
jgi:hypothetical protein